MGIPSHLGEPRRRRFAIQVRSSSWRPLRLRFEAIGSEGSIAFVMLFQALNGFLQLVPQRLCNVKVNVKQFNPFVARLKLNMTAAAFDIDGKPYMPCGCHVMRC